MKYNKWTILEMLPKGKCIAQCECGETHTRHISNIKSGKSKQCTKCQAKQYKKTTNLKTHGLSNERLYAKWGSMKARCYNKNTKSYKDYGEHGVEVCDEWKNDYLSFRKWALENGYKPNLEISRIKDIGNYEPSNCRFITKTKNMKEALKGKHHTYQRIIKMVLTKMKLSSDEYYKIIDMAMSGKYKATELEKLTGRDRHVLLDMCRREGNEPNWNRG